MSGRRSLQADLARPPDPGEAARIVVEVTQDDRAARLHSLASWDGWEEERLEGVDELVPGHVHARRASGMHLSHADGVWWLPLWVGVSVCDGMWWRHTECWTRRP